MSGCWPVCAQVYGIVACQLGLTALVAAVIMCETSTGCLRCKTSFLNCMPLTNL